MNDLDGRIAVLNVQEGDVLVFRTSHLIPAEAARHISDMIDRKLVEAGAPRVPVLVLDAGSTLEVLRHVPGKSPFVTRAELPNAIRDIEKRRL